LRDIPQNRAAKAGISLEMAGKDAGKKNSAAQNQATREK
jgi:hypothetical protein